MTVMKSTFSLLDSSLLTGIVINVVLSVVLGLSMKQIWNLINTLQILTHIPMMNIPLSSNIIACLETIIGISNMSVIPKWLITMIFDSVQSFSQQTNSSFQEMDIF